MPTRDHFRYTIIDQKPLFTFRIVDEKKIIDEKNYQWKWYTSLDNLHKWPVHVSRTGWSSVFGQDRSADYKLRRSGYVLDAQIAGPIFGKILCVLRFVSKMKLLAEYRMCHNLVNLFRHRIGQAIFGAELAPLRYRLEFCAGGLSFMIISKVIPCTVWRKFIYI